MTITLATLEQATEQQVFDQVATHLLTQREASRVPTDLGSECRYRGPNGLMCAAGCLISDEEYKDVMEGHGWDSMAVTGDHKKLIICLQELHDDRKVRYWYTGLIAISQVFSLNADGLVKHPDDTHDLDVQFAVYRRAQHIKKRTF